MNNEEAGLIMKNLFNKHLVKHEPAEPANYELASRNIDRATNCHSLEMEAAPVVELLKCSNCGLLLTTSGDYCDNPNHLTTLERALRKKPETGSTRPEMPPDILKQVEICEQNKTKWAHFKVEDIRELLKRAASVQQEPLREALLKLKSFNEDIAEGKINYRPEDHLFYINRALQSQPAAPGTQPPPRTPVCPNKKCGVIDTLIFHGNCTVSCLACKEIWEPRGISDFAQFFTALPEAQPVNKKEPK